MASRYVVEVTITSASDLKNVNWRHGKLKPYAVLWVDPNTKFSTHVDEENDTCPTWNEKLTIPFNSPIQDSTLYIDIVHHDEGTKPLIGSCKLRLCDIGFGNLFDKKLELKRPSGRPQGNVEVKVIVRELQYSNYDPSYGVTPAYGYNYPPLGYPYVPPGYGTQVGGYGQQGSSGSSRLGEIGTGLGVGAVVGALGGLALAEGVDVLEEKIEDDIVERVEDDLCYVGDDF